MSPEKNVAVIFVFVDQSRRILLEKRPLIGSYGGQVIFPGGKVENYELQDWELTLRREIKEEFGVIPTVFEPLLSEPFVAETGRSIYPYVITSWQGDIPKNILDKDNGELIWEDIDHYQPLFESTRKITSALKNYLVKKQ